MPNAPTPSAITSTAAYLKTERIRPSANTRGLRRAARSKLINYDEMPREQALAQAKADAVELAVEAGAIRETVEIIEVEDVPLAYYPGNTSRVKIKAAGDLRA